MLLSPNRHSLVGKRSSRLATLASVVQQEVSFIDGHIEAQGLPKPSLDVGAPMELPSSLVEHQQSLLGALEELHALVAGPLQYLMRLVSPVHNITFAVQILHRYDIPRKVPLPRDNSAPKPKSTTKVTSDRPVNPQDIVSFASLAASTSLPEQVLTRVLRVLIANRIFDEPEPCYLAHNGVSQLFLTVPGLDQWLGFFTDEVAPAASHAADALQIWPGSAKPFETGWNLAAAASGRPVVNKSIFQHLQENPAAMRRFSDGFDFLCGSPAYSPHHLAENLGWDGRNKCPQTVVDVGNAAGSVGVHLLRRFPSIRQYIVQDLPEHVQQVQAAVPNDLRGRMRFQPWNLFAGWQIDDDGVMMIDHQQGRQLFPHADVYLLRNVLHQCSDEYAIAALRRIAGVLRPDSRIVINEICLPSPGALPGALPGTSPGTSPGSLSHYQAQLVHGCDLSMLHVLNARERSGPDWEMLVREADPGLAVLSVTQVPDAMHAVIVVGFGR